VPEETKESYAVLYYELTESWRHAGHERTYSLQVTPPQDGLEAARQLMREFNNRGWHGFIVRVVK
jgi:hypothetical protein